MPATLTTLPPELQREILSYLPRPSLGPPLPAPSPLLATSLLSPTMRELSQELLFHSVRLGRCKQTERWQGARAGRSTRELKVEYSRRRGEDAWLRRAIEGCKDGRVGVLELVMVTEEDVLECWDAIEQVEGKPARPGPGLSGPADQLT